MRSSSSAPASARCADAGGAGRRIALAWLLLCCLAQTLLATVPPLPLPSPAGRVTDQTATLDDAQLKALEAGLDAFERERGSQIAVLIVDSVGGEALEAYALRIAEAWQLGRDGVDDGLLLLIATQDRSVRIEVGYGLEGAVSDATASRIIHETMLPRFADGDYYGGIAAGLELLQRVIGGEALPEPLPAPGGEWTMSMEDGQLFMVTLFPTIFLAMLLRSRTGRLLAGLGAGLIGGGAGWYFSGSWTLGAFLFGLLFVGIAVADAGGGSAGGRSGGSGGSAGGFSGGGGRFGGGGASGRW